MIDLILDALTRSHEVDRRLDPHRTISGLVIRPRSQQILGVVHEKCLEHRVSRIGFAGKLGAEVLKQKGRQTGHGGRGHRRSTQRRIRRIAAHGTGRDAQVAITLATGCDQIRLEASIVRRPPTAEGGHRVIVRVDGPHANVVLGSGRRRHTVICAKSFNITSASRSFVARRPNDPERTAKTAEDDRVDQGGRNAIVTLDFAIEQVGLDVAANGVVGDVGPEDVDRLVIVGLEIAGVGVKDDVRATEFETVGKKCNARRHPFEGSVTDSRTPNRTGDMR